MKEKDIRRQLRALLGSSGILYFPPQVRFYQNDVFGAYDALYYEYKTRRVHFIQITSLSNVSHRRKKILSIFEGRPPTGSYIYAWNDKLGQFRILKVEQSVT